MKSYSDERREGWNKSLNKKRVELNKELKEKVKSHLEKAKTYEAITNLSEFINSVSLCSDHRQKMHDALSVLENKAIRFDNILEHSMNQGSTLKPDCYDSNLIDITKIFHFATTRAKYKPKKEMI